MRDPYGATPERLDSSIFRYTPRALWLALQSPSAVNFIKEAMHASLFTRSSSADVRVR